MQLSDVIKLNDYWNDKKKQSEMEACVDSYEQGTRSRLASLHPHNN